MHGGKVYKGLLHKSKGPSSYLLLGWFMPKKIPTKLKFCYNYWGVESQELMYLLQVGIIDVYSRNWVLESLL